METKILHNRIKTNFLIAFSEEFGFKVLQTLLKLKQASAQTAGYITKDQTLTLLNYQSQATTYRHLKILLQASFIVKLKTKNGIIKYKVTSIDTWQNELMDCTGRDVLVPQNIEVNDLKKVIVESVIKFIQRRNTKKRGVYASASLSLIKQYTNWSNQTISSITKNLKRKAITEYLTTIPKKDKPLFCDIHGYSFQFIPRGEKIIIKKHFGFSYSL